MKLSYVFIIVAIIITVVEVAEAKTYPNGEIGPYRMTQVDKVYDGDTFYGWAQTFIYQTTYMKIRARGIDTPELRGSSACEKALGFKARDYAASLLSNSNFVLLYNVRYDNFGRVLAEVHLSQGKLADLMIASGHARPYIKNDKTEWCVSS